MEPAETIEVPSSPDMSIDVENNTMIIEPRRTVAQETLARSDPQRLVQGTLARSDPTRIAQGHRNLEMEAEIYRLRTELNTEAIAGRHRIQEVHAHSRALTRSVMAQQNEAFQDVARQYQDASAEATAAAVYKERSHQEAERHQQLNICRNRSSCKA